MNKLRTIKNNLSSALQPQLISTQSQLLTFNVVLLDSGYSFNFPASEFRLDNDELFVRCLSSLLIKIQWEQNLNSNNWLDAVATLGMYVNQNKRLVCKLIEKIPILVQRYYPNLSDESKEKLNDIYSSVSTWLWYWANDLPTKEFLKNPKMKAYRSLAIVCKKRHELIQYLFSELDEPIINTTLLKNPELAWLFSECSYFLTNILTSVDCKNTAYENEARYLRYLDDYTAKSPRETTEFFNPDNTEDWLDYTHLYLDHIAALHYQIVSDGGYYEDNFYTPYVKARTTWNSIRKRPQYQVLLVDGRKVHDKPGRRIGAKYRKC
ncbi:hypothetical protein F7734_52805 [Scytonema sp. UIC 10036]|uniref:hypothetical protein n=1 Tax=Scytonema sp. UIC 10036 TaxID=2304196 RepID=UPI0012DA069D|nr:hypothetical protein [Scytonema sp. UIC 10036]MUH00496.1 hypothetical protein [Scytonema sp. UIC 10036]